MTCDFLSFAFSIISFLSTFYEIRKINVELRKINIYFIRADQEENGVCNDFLFLLLFPVLLLLIQFDQSFKHDLLFFYPNESKID